MHWLDFLLGFVFGIASFIGLVVLLARLSYRRVSMPHPPIYPKDPK